MSEICNIRIRMFGISRMNELQQMFSDINPYVFLNLSTNCLKSVTELGEMKKMLRVSGKK